MSWVGTAYCEYCEQIVDVYYSNDEGTERFECGFCGREIKVETDNYIIEKKEELTYEQEDLILEEGLERWREQREKL